MSQNHRTFDWIGFAYTLKPRLSWCSKVLRGHSKMKGNTFNVEVPHCSISAHYWVDLAWRMSSPNALPSTCAKFFSKRTRSYYISRSITWHFPTHINRTAAGAKPKTYTLLIFRSAILAWLPPREFTVKFKSMQVYQPSCLPTSTYELQINRGCLRKLVLTKHFVGIRKLTFARRGPSFKDKDVPGCCDFLMYALDPSQLSDHDLKITLRAIEPHQTLLIAVLVRKLVDKINWDELSHKVPSEH